MVRPTGFIDIHHHLVWGMDDGPRSFEQSADMLRAASRDEISHIIATTHATPGINDFDTAVYHSRLDALNEYSALHKLNITVLPGAEIMYTDKTTECLRMGKIPSLANSAYVLVEFRQDADYEYIYDAARSLANGGYVPVIAHAERYASLFKHPGRIIEIKEQFDARIQVNCSTILNTKGRLQRRALEKVLRLEHPDYVATDSHNTGSRAVCMRECYCALAEMLDARSAMALVGHNQREIISSFFSSHKADEHVNQAHRVRVKDTTN